MQKLNVEGTKNLGNTSIRVGDKLIDLSTPIVMGILNVTPDSFYANSRLISEKDLLLKAEKMISDGVTIVDIGGYSSRPGADNISTEEEIRRITPAIEAIRKEFPSLYVSLDTFRSKVAEQGIQSGAQIINDISGFSIDEKLVHTICNYNIPYVLMHMKGTPKTMQSETDYDNIFTEMVSYFSKKIDLLESKGVTDIVIDPGFGFSKTNAQNHFILNHLEHFSILKKPILAGVSRKSMIYKKLGITPESSLNGTIALNAIALSKGASILRVHDVKEAKEIIDLLY